MRLRTFLAAFALPLATTTPATAASADAVTIQGSGAISPGRTLVAAPQWVGFTGTAFAVGTDGLPGTYACSFTGVITESVLGGTGSMSGFCGPLPFWSCAVVATTVTWTVACTDPSRNLGALECLLTPTNVNPNTQYTVLCAGAAARA
ncbi:MAG TPA: hypothetical protein VGX28_08690 [Frankiaceae bacterium]|jgi:hypothetical protein|nr:hypothetical protein [Frankiaceae bacterium]